MGKTIAIFFFCLMASSFGWGAEDFTVRTSRDAYTIDDEGRLQDFEITVTNHTPQAQIFLYFGAVTMNWLEVQKDGVVSRMLPYTAGNMNAFRVTPPEMRERMIVENPDYVPHYEGYLLHPGETITLSFAPLIFGKRDKYWEVIPSEEDLTLTAVYHYTYMSRDSFPLGPEKYVTTNSFQIKCKKTWFEKADKWNR